MGNETTQVRRKTNRNSFSVDFGNDTASKIKPNVSYKLSPINQSKQRSQLQVSSHENGSEEKEGESRLKRIQSEIKKQNNIRLKKLTSTNDQLRKQLIKISSQLTEKLKKKKFQVKKIEDKDTNHTNLNKRQSLKKQLQNAYKQIDMYKRLLSDLKIGEHSSTKLVYVEDKITMVDLEIQKTIKQIQAIKNVNNNQNIGIKNHKQKGSQVIQQLKNEIQSLKLLLKQKSKQERTKQKVYMKQHYYMKALEQKVKQINNEYEQQQNRNKAVEDKKHSQEQIKKLQQQLDQIKQKHDQYHKRINTYLTSNKLLKQEKKDRQKQLEEKNKVIEGLKYKRDAFVKQIKDNLHLFVTQTQNKQQEQLSEFQSEEEQQPDPIQQQQDQRGTFDVNHLKDHNLKLLSKQEILKKRQSEAPIQEQSHRSQPKLWKKQLTRIITKGKQMADEKKFSTGLNTIPRVDIKIVEMSVWMNKKKQITAIQPSYLVDGRIMEGNKSSKNIQDEYRVVFELQQHDFLKGVLGIFGKSGFLEYLVLQSNFGKISKIGREQTDGDNFAIGVAKQETPVQITGASRQDGAYWRISKLDFQVLIQH